MIRAFLTETAYETIEPQLADLPVTPVFVGSESLDFEIAWASSDMYQDGRTRPFFGAVVRSPTLKWLQASNAGTDDPVFARIMGNGVTITTSHVTGPPIAEWALRSVLDWFQHADDWRSAAAAHRWKPHEFREVYGTTWLVIGLGAIGGAVAERARAFGAHVIGVRRTPRGDEPVDELITPADVSAALPRADVVVIAAPADAANEHMVDAAFLAAMKPGSVLVNPSRGLLVDENALLAALDRGVPDAALLDVAASEPLGEDSPLWTHPKVVLTPHSSALGSGRHDRAATVFVENLRRYVAGEALKSVVPNDEVRPAGPTDEAAR